MSDDISTIDWPELVEVPPDPTPPPTGVGDDTEEGGGA